jgi:hypothetical protein
VRNPEIPREALTEHGTALDILAELDDDRRIDIEMQCAQDPETRRIAERRAMELSAWKHDLEASGSEGRVEGRAEAVRWITDLCELLQIDVDDARRARLEAMSGEELEELRLALKRARPSRHT